MIKHIFTLLFVMTIFLVSCSAEEEIVKKEAEWVNINGMSIRKSDVYTTRPAGIAPYGHKSYFIIGPEYNLVKLDKLYREEFDHPDSLSLDYNINVKNKAFLFLMRFGLADKGTPEQKKYYLNEQLELERNLPSFQDFNILLNSSLDLLSEEEALLMAQQFYKKNKKAIEEINWKDAEERNAKIVELTLIHEKTIESILLHTD